MLKRLTEKQPDPGERPDTILFLRLDRRASTRDVDVGLHRHWLDPSIPFAATLAAPAQGLLVTSATCATAATRSRKSPGPPPKPVSARRIASPAIRAAVASPFDYAEQTRAFWSAIVAPGNLDQLAAAYQGSVPGRGRRRTRTVHRHLPAEGGA